MTRCPRTPNASANTTRPQHSSSRAQLQLLQSYTQVQECKQPHNPYNTTTQAALSDSNDRQEAAKPSQPATPNVTHTCRPQVLLKQPPAVCIAAYGITAQAATVLLLLLLAATTVLPQVQTRLIPTNCIP
jgi:hypothetical protein